MELLEGLPDGVVGVKAIGEVEEEDYEEVLEPAIEDHLSRHDKIRFLYELGPEFTGYDAEAMWEDTKLGMKTCADYERIAVVTDSHWLQRTVKAVGWLMPGEVKVYPHDRFDEAKAWITS